MSQPLADHPHADPGDGRTECRTCGKWVWEVTHSCKRVPVTVAAWNRLLDDQIKAWHQSPISDPTPLHEYLGMTWNEYSAWTENESAIPARWLT